MPLSDAYEAIVLNILYRSDTTGIPAGWGLALSTSVPTASTFAEVGTGSGYQRQTINHAPAASPAGTNSNSVAATFGPFSSACTISAFGVFNTAGTGGACISWNTLSAARTLSAGDTLFFPVGQLTNAVA